MLTGGGRGGTRRGEGVSLSPVLLEYDFVPFSKASKEKKKVTNEKRRDGPSIAIFR